MQTHFSFFLAESYEIALKTGLRDVIPLIELFKLVMTTGLMFNSAIPLPLCKFFEDNRACLETSSAHKMRTRTKHINVQHVTNCKIGGIRAAIRQNYIQAGRQVAI
jgi:hypothetical protein